MIDQWKVMLFCHDAKGLGHLRRICRIASALQSGGDFACLIISGMRDAHWLVPKECELLKLPSWDGLSAKRSRLNGSTQWLRISGERACGIRSDLIKSVGEIFQPHAIIVDYLPFGLSDELRPLLVSTPARKYFIHRGIADRADQDVLFGNASHNIAEVYDRIVVTADRRISDVAHEYKFVSKASERIIYAGYIRPPARNGMDPIEAGSSLRRPLIVCSCGGGVGGERLLSACVKAAQKSGGYDFEVVLGPHGSLQRGLEQDVPPNCKVTRIHNEMTDLHQRATVVISHGGYNSMLEAVSGGARILVVHIQGNDCDERIHFQERLMSYYPVRALTNLERLEKEIVTEVNLAQMSAVPRFDLSFDGLRAITAILRKDLCKTHGIAALNSVGEAQGSRDGL